MKFILSIGTNQNPREENLRRAVSWLSQIGESCYVSTPYRTAPIGKDEGDECKHYLNAVAVMDVDDGYTLTSLGRMLKAYEAGAGRTAEARAEGRVPVDIDVVICDGCIIRPKDFDRYYFRQGYEELLSAGVI